MAGEARRRKEKAARRTSEVRVRKGLPDAFERLLEAAGRQEGADIDLAAAVVEGRRLQDEPGYDAAMRKLRRRSQDANPRS